MRIVIDMQCTQSHASKGRGVGRYCLGLVKSLLRLAGKKHDFYLVFNGCFSSELQEMREEFKLLLPKDHIKSWQQHPFNISGLSGSQPLSDAFQYVREWYINQLQADLIWSTNLQEGWHDNAVTSVKRINSGAIYCSSLYDVIPLLYPEKYLKGEIKDWYLDKIEYAKQSDYLLTCSEFSKKAISKELDYNISNIEVLYADADHNVFSKNSELDIVEHFGLKAKNFLLYVGGGDRHKNINSLLSAYSKLSPELCRQYSLVIAGADFIQNQDINNELYLKLKTLNVDKENIIVLGGVSDAELHALYCNCALFVFPSFSEGFGMPPLEAMVCGALVLTSNASSLPEVMGNEEFEFDPHDSAFLSKLITRVLSDCEFKRRLHEHIAKRVDFFSWDKSAQKLIKFFNTLTKESKRTLITAQQNDQYLYQGLASLSDLTHDELKLISQSISNSVIESKKKIFLDISSLIHFDHATGIQRVVRAICDVLLRKDFQEIDFEIVFSYVGNDNFYYPKKSDGKFCFPKEDEFNDSIVDFSDGDILVFLDLHPGNGFSKKQLIQQLRARNVSSYFVVYDLLPISHPKYFVPELVSEFTLWLESVISSDGALCISKDVSNKLYEWVTHNNKVPSNEFRYEYFHLGANLDDSDPSTGIPDYAKHVEEVCSKMKTFLMVGTVEPRKGHALALDAFEQLWSAGDDVALIIVGKAGWCNDVTIQRIREHKEFNKRLFWMEGISDEYLDIVYQQASSLLAASEGEGFGLPLIEAAQYNLPIIARDLEVFKEVAAEGAFYFNGNSEDLAGKILEWIDLYLQDKHPRSGTIKWLTWEESAEQLLKCLNVN